MYYIKPKKIIMTVKINAFPCMKNLSSVNNVYIFLFIDRNINLHN